MTMQAQLVQVDVSAGIATIKLDDPASRNGLSVPMQQQLLDALAGLAGRGDVGALVLTGAGKAFCAGANLTGMDQGADGMSVGQRGADLLEQLANPLIMALQALPMPVLCAVNGAAAGAGMSVALACDIVLAGRSAFFLAPFLPRLGILPDLGATWLLPHMAGRARSLGIMLLGERLAAQQACDWGLIWAVVDDDQLLQHARATALRLARAPAHSALEARRALAAAATNSLAEQLNYEVQRQRDLLDRPAFAEGVRAFFEKREPVFARPTCE